MQTTFMQIMVGKKKLTCNVESESPVVEYRKKGYTLVHDLAKVLPDLLAPDHVAELVKVANFLSGGKQYALIEDVPIFQRSYRRRIWQEKSSMNATHPRLSDHGVFEVGGMHEPRVLRGKLIFFVEHLETGVPYKATFAMSIRTQQGEVSYEQLPEVD